MKILIHLVLFMTLFTSCQKAESNEPVTLIAKNKLNVSYGNDSAQRMDIYLPAGRSAATTPSIILIHGGGWNSGDKSDFKSYIDTFKKRLPEYAIFNLNYRLATTNTIFPSQEMDVKAAMEHIVTHAADYGVSKDKFVLLGASAGAHLALLQAYKYASPDIKAVVNFFGPTDLTAMYNKPWHTMIPYLLQLLLGTTPQANPSAYEQSSPTFFVNAQSAPTIILQGGLDNVVDPSQSYLLQEKLEQAGVKHELVLYPNERHGWYGANLSHSFDRIEAFLDEHVN
jgi:acetyl esterase/lipase